jgi:3-phenylpropionate/trans-cinnamate dioxygenase ferredoxin subunit
MTLYRVASVHDIPEGESRDFLVNRIEVAIVNLGNGQFRAIDDICSHALSFLHEGEVDVEDETIECAKHGSTFDLNTGKPLVLPATRPVPVYPLKIDGDDILIEVNDE